MDHYLEIRVLPDPEFSEEMLMAALVAKLHRALGQRGQGDIGISFPAYGLKLGPVLRVHGHHQALSELEALSWRKGLSDYCMSSDIQPVPVVNQWRCVSRVQVKSSAQRLMRRSVKKGWLTEEEAQQRLLTMQEVRIYPGLTCAVSLPASLLSSSFAMVICSLRLSPGCLRPTDSVRRRRFPGSDTHNRIRVQGAVFSARRVSKIKGSC